MKKKRTLEEVDDWREVLIRCCFDEFGNAPIQLTSAFVKKALKTLPRREHHDLLLLDKERIEDRLKYLAANNGGTGFRVIEKGGEFYIRPSRVHLDVECKDTEAPNCKEHKNHNALAALGHDVKSKTAGSTVETNGPAISRETAKKPLSLPTKRLYLPNDHRHRDEQYAEVNWVEIASEVAKALRGEPDNILRQGKEWRWGRRGSFSLDTEKGTFADYEAQVFGGVIDMVEHELSTDRKGALDWLKENQFLPSNSPTAPAPVPRRPKQASTTPNLPQKAKPKPKGKGKIDYGLTLWKDSTPIPKDSNHCARLWIADRKLIPVGAVVPHCIRWHESKGLIIACVAPLKDWHQAYPELPTPGAIHAIAIDKQGQKRMAFGESEDKRIFGQMDGVGLVVIGNPNSKTINICEGLADALAISSRVDGTVIATITTVAKIRNDSEALAKIAPMKLRLFSDSDKAGRKATEVLIQALWAAGASHVELRTSNTAKDPAEEAGREGT